MKHSSSTNSNYYLINSAQDINYLCMLNDFDAFFNNKIVRIRTNFKELVNINIVFEDEFLPHLMGWEKISDEHRAKQIITNIRNKSFTFENTRKNSEFYSVKDKMLNYNFLHQIFLTRTIQPLLLYTSTMQPNKYRIDIILQSKNSEKKYCILGCRKNKNSYFYPNTLQVRRNLSPFQGLKTVSIIEQSDLLPNNFKMQ